MALTRASQDFRNKTNVNPSLDRTKEATAEDFQEAASLLDEYAQAIEDLQPQQSPNPFYGRFNTLAALKASFPTAVLNSWAIIDAGVGVTPLIAVWDNVEQDWEIAGTSELIIYAAQFSALPQTGNEQNIYITLNDNQPYIWQTNQYKPLIANNTSSPRLRTVLDIVDNTQLPQSETEGDRFILDFTSGGVNADWDGANEGDVVEFKNGTWQAYKPKEGDITYVDNKDNDYRFINDGTPTWEEVISLLPDNFVDEIELETALRNYELQENEVPVVFIFGQSNADGRGVITDLPDLDTSFNGEVKIWDKSVTREPGNATTNRVDDGVWKDYQLGDMVITPQGAAADSFGIELQIARRWKTEEYSKNQKPLYIIKLAVGNSSLADDDIDESWSNTDDSLRQLALNYFAEPAIRQLQIDGLNPVCLGIIWGQGEHDASIEAKSLNYLTNLQNFLPSFITQIGFENARIMVMGLSNHRNDANWNRVKQAQIDFCNLNPNAVLIPTDGSDNKVPISRYVDGISAGAIHYSSDGLLTLGNKFYNNLDLLGERFTENFWDFSFYGKTAKAGEEISLNNLITYDTWGQLGFVQYPTNIDNRNAVTWVRNADMPARPAISTEPSPSFFVNSMRDTNNVEIIISLLHDGDIDTKPGVWFRLDGDITPESGYLSQIRQGGGELTIFKRFQGSFTSLGSSPVTPTISPSAAQPFWYRIRMVGGLLTFENSADGRNWTLQHSYNDLTDLIQSGDVGITLLNGRIDKAIGNLRVAHCAFDVVLVKNLDRNGGINIQPPSLLPNNDDIILDDFPGASIAYSLRYLKTGVTNVIQVERDSDNTTRDFRPTELVDGTLADWVGVGNNGFVRIWYDQSGNNRHLNFLDLSNKIVSNGLVLLDNNLPYVEYDGNTLFDRYTTSNGAGLSGSSGSCFHTFNTDSDEAAMSYVAAGSYIGAMQLNSTNATGMDTFTPNPDYYANGVLISPISRGILFDNLFKDKDVLVSVLNIDFGSSNDWLGNVIPVAFTSNSFTAPMKAKEFIIYDTDQSANQTAIENNKKSYYSIF